MAARARKVAGMKKLFFLRGDDVTRAGPAFTTIFKLLLAEGLPVVYAVIPALATPSLRRLLTSHPAAGRLFETAQHGLRHKDHSGNRFMRQEFGPARNLRFQSEDIRAGAVLMRRNFGRLFIPVFVPPFHVYNSDTVSAAEKAGLKAISASKQLPSMRAHGPLFLPAMINVNDYGVDLKARPLDPAALKRKTLAALKRPGTAVGAYFHHTDITGRDLRVFREYLIFLKDMVRRDLIVPALFSDMLGRLRE